MLINEKHLAELNSPIQTIQSRVELHNGSTLEQICTCNDYVRDFTIERVGEGKFFGYGICHKLKINFIDPNRDLNLTNVDSVEVTFGVDGDFIYPFPKFFITEVNRDETTNEIGVTAYDTLYQANNYKVSELILPETYDILYFTSACAALLGVPLKIVNIDDFRAFQTNYEGNANFDGTEPLRQALNAIAEATQTIYYINGDWELTFKRLDQTGDSVLTIDKTKYIELKSGANRRLGAICHTNELGDTVIAKTAETGTTQYLRSNPFLELREDIGTLLDNAITVVGGLTINPFDCNWIGNYLLEIGDKITLVAENDSEIVTYIVDDSITFDGTLGQNSRWEYVEDEAESAENPTSLGDALNQTFARVDKANKQIELLVSEVNGNSSAISTLQLTSDSISASVKKVEEDMGNSIATVNGNFETLSKQVSAKMSAEDVQIAIESELSNGVEKVVTSTGFLFNEEGLTISKSDSEINTTITEDGMTITKNSSEVLVANNQGVKAEDLHATTYLIIGTNSRIEDYGERSACFWIGG